jgi:hypothetical protein
VGGREGYRQQPLLRPLGEVPLRRRSRHPSRRIRRNRCRLFYLRRWCEHRRGRKAKPRRPRAPGTEPLRRRPTRLRERQRAAHLQESRERCESGRRWIISLSRSGRSTGSRRPGICAAGCGRICPARRGRGISFSSSRRTEGAVHRLTGSRPLTSSSRTFSVAPSAQRVVVRS